MSIPHHPQKFNSKISITAEDMFFKNNRIEDLSSLPKAPDGCIFSPITRVQPPIQKRLTLKPGPEIIQPIYLTNEKNIAVFYDFVGFGAPMWGWVFEQLISYGIKKFVYIGVFGRAVPKYDLNAVYVVKKALRDEGVSYHYINNEDHYAYPDEEMTEKLLSMGAKPATVWSTDCMFRQTVAELEYAKQEDIAGFEMECSALFAIAKEMGVKICSLQVISDYYENGKFISVISKDVCNKNLDRAVEMAIELLK